MVKNYTEERRDDMEDTFIDHDTDRGIASVDSDWEPLVRLGRDKLVAATKLRQSDLGFLVDLFYQVQQIRTRLDNQMTIARKTGEPNELLTWCFDNFRFFEGDIKKAMNAFCERYTAGIWAMSITGIGPILAAGMLAYYDIRIANTVGKMWRLSGLDPTRVWYGKDKAEELIKTCGIDTKFDQAKIHELAKIVKYRPEQLIDAWQNGFAKAKGLAALKKYLARRPWIATLKTLVVFKMGECFVKFRNHENDFYGKIFFAHKLKEIDLNKAGKLADEADRAKSKLKSKTTETWQWVTGCYTADVWDGFLEMTLPERAEHMNRCRVPEGTGVKMLSPAHLHARARRYAVKLFLSHFHEVMHWDYFQKAPPAPYIFEHPEGTLHSHKIAVPNWPLPPGESKKAKKILVEARTLHDLLDAAEIACNEVDAEEGL